MVSGISTDDGGLVQEGDRAYNYYDMKPGVLGEVQLKDDPSGPWFQFHHDDGTRALLNGQRICTMDFARMRGFRDADPAEPIPDEAEVAT